MHQDAVIQGTETRLLSDFPKRRPPLPEGIAKIYLAHYKQNRDGATPVTSLSRRMESWLHRQVASDVLTDQSEKRTLEIGAGTLNQLPYEPIVGRYDIIEPFKQLYEGSPLLSRVDATYTDISEIPQTERYDRITSAAVLEHLCDLPEVVARSALLLSPDGVFRASIPSEGAFLWNLSWRLTTGLEFRLKHGLDYRQLLNHEHVNTATEIESVLRYFFRNVSRRILGLSRTFSFYQFFSCSDPDVQKCGAYLQELDKPAGGDLRTT